MFRRLAALFLALVMVVIAAAPALAVKSLPASDRNPAAVYSMPGAPIAVQTSTASDVTTSSAILHGYLDGMGALPERNRLVQIRQYHRLRQDHQPDDPV